MPGNTTTNIYVIPQVSLIQYLLSYPRALFFVHANIGDDSYFSIIWFSNLASIQALGRFIFVKIECIFSSPFERSIWYLLFFVSRLIKKMVNIRKPSATLSKTCSKCWGNWLNWFWLDWNVHFVNLIILITIILWKTKMFLNAAHKMVSLERPALHIATYFPFLAFSSSPSFSLVLYLEIIMMFF